jgi:cytochrome c2
MVQHQNIVHDRRIPEDKPLRAEAKDRIATLADSFHSEITKWFEHNKPSKVFPTCLTCHHVDKATHMCNKFKILPPLHVTVGDTKCEAYWDAEDIPF